MTGMAAPIEPLVAVKIPWEVSQVVAQKAKVKGKEPEVGASRAAVKTVAANWVGEAMAVPTAVMAAARVAASEGRWAGPPAP